HPLELIRSALHNGVELTARGMPKFRRKLVLQHGKFSNRIVGHFHQGAGNACVVVVHALDGEIVIARSLSPHRGTRPHSDSATGRNSGSKQRKIQNATARVTTSGRSEEHTSELQSQSNLVCRLLLEKKKGK